MRWARALHVATFAWVVAGCTTSPERMPPGSEAMPTARATRPAPVDPALGDRILALDPEHVSDSDVRQVLAKGPTPHVIAIHGGVYPVHLVMDSFARFLTRMGYPERAIRDPGDRSFTQSPYTEAAVLAGEIAWYYEREGVMPVMVGHSQGGMQVVKVLYELAGLFDTAVPVYDPSGSGVEPRTTIVDPLTGARRAVTTLKVQYATAVSAGGAATLLPNQWIMKSRLYRIPDSVVDFTGFMLALDLIAWDGPATDHHYRALDVAHVRNVTLPATYAHIFVVDVGPLAKDEAARAWINAYTPDLAGTSPPANVDLPNILWAADVWYSIKKAWVIEAQALVRAQRKPPAPPAARGAAH
ncbi:MAG: hypothetical protein JSR18_02655 [Proteobacteria bacterium]|nr:hypothetical protein [Pseudomonadota bacterium]